MKYKLLVLLLILFRITTYGQPDESRIKISEDIHLLKINPKTYLHLLFSNQIVEKGYSKRFIAD
jgi:hypothetical protein